MPDGTYSPPAPVQQLDTGELVVDFHGEDGRHQVFHLSQMPLPGWHAALAQALAIRLGPAGARRTLASARSEWQTVRRFLRILTQLPRPPSAPSQLRTTHVEIWHRRRMTETGDKRAAAELRAIGALLGTDAFSNHIGSEPMDYLQRWVRTSDPAPTSGYSDRELHSLITAARTDVVSLRDRLRVSGELLDQARRAPQDLDPAQRQQAALLARIASDGEVPWPGGEFGAGQRRRRELAAQIFVTIYDVAPLLVLGIALTGRNVETLKELPVEHRILEAAPSRSV